MGRRDVALARPCAAVTQRRELWPHALQLSARSRWVPSTCSPHRPRSWHPQAAEMLLGAPPPEPPAIAAGCNAAASMAAVPPQDAPPAPQGLPHGRSPRTRRWGPQRHSSQDPSPQPSSSGRAQLVRLDQHPCSPQKADCAGVPRPEVAEMHPLNPSGSAGPAAQWVAAAQFRCRGAGDPGDRRGCRGAVGAESRRLCPP